MSGQAGTVNGFNSVRIENALVPAEGPKIVPLTLDFTSALSFEIDLTLAINQKKIEIVQGIYIDNSRAVSTFTIRAQASNQEISIPAGAQGYYPLLAGQLPRFTATSNGGVVPVYIAFLNVPVPALQWNSGIGGSLGAVAQGAPGALAWPVRVQNLTGNIDGANPLIIAPSDPVITATATIAISTNESGSIIIPEGYALANLIPPASGWTAANIWLRGSHDNVTFYNITDANGNNIVIPFDAVLARSIPPALLTGWPFLRLQSVNTATPTTPVNQAAARVIGYSLTRIV
jgi:hypothetical protein